MNLHRTVSSAIAAVNPHVIGVVSISTGSTTGSDGKRVPAFRNIPDVKMQVQALSTREMRLLDGMNLQGTLRKIYLYGKFDGLVRPEGKGGDLVTLPNGQIWLINMVMEQWPDWCSVAVTLQNGA